MKIHIWNYYPLMLGLLSLLIVGCQQSDFENTQILPKIIDPGLAKEGISSDQGANFSGSPEFKDNQEPKIPIAHNEVLLNLLNVNLDLDQTDEQILVLKDRENSGTPIKVAVIDFDEVRDSYIRTYEHDTQAINQRAFRIEIEDIVGDHNVEIVCTGLNSEGRLTLDVFRKTTSPSGLGLFFSSICRLSSDRSILIERHKRPQSYQLGQKYGQSFPIILERRDEESGNNLDIIRETYYWKYQEKEYIKSRVDKIAGDELMQKQLRELFSERSTEEDFQEFLKGSWYMHNSIENIALFSPNQNMVSFYDGNILEIYKIENLIRHGYSVSLITRNSTINSIVKWIIITIRSVNSIEISGSKTRHASLMDKEQWEGLYTRLTSDLKESFLQPQKSYIKAGDIYLSGIYRNSQGIEIAFEPPYFTWLQDSLTGSSGGFSIMSNVPLLNGFYLEREIGDRVDILTFRFMELSGIFIEDRTFHIEYSERKENSTRVRTIVLTPVDMLVNGAVLTSKEPLILEQIETIED